MCLVLLRSPVLVERLDANYKGYFRRISLFILIVCWLKRKKRGLSASPSVVCLLSVTNVGCLVLGFLNYPRLKEKTAENFCILIFIIIISQSLSIK